MASISDKGQVVPTELTAFGIILGSRHGMASELVELLQFAQAVASSGAAGLVRSAWYDSNSSVCSIELRNGMDQTDARAAAVAAAAAQTLSQYEWQGLIQHAAGR